MKNRDTVLIISLFVYLTVDVDNKYPYFIALCNFLFSDMQYRESGYTFSLFSQYNADKHPIVKFKFNEPITYPEKSFLELGN